MCDEWVHNYIAFQRWAFANGYNDELTIDRIDNSKGYSPDNCKWATPKEQCYNRSNSRSITICGVMKSIKEWATMLGLSYKGAMTYIYRMENKNS